MFRKVRFVKFTRCGLGEVAFCKYAQKCLHDESWERVCLVKYAA